MGSGSNSEIQRAAGQVLIGGFTGVELSARYRSALERGERGGVILFRRNIGSLEQVMALTASVAAVMPQTIIAVDQEGGRVARLGPPCLKLPPAMRLASRGEAFVREVAKAQALELIHLGFTLNFAPVLDVHLEPDNPIIGDRAFGTAPEDAARLALAFASGAADGGLLTCGKHFPGHGATTTDSHLELPRVQRSRDALEADLLPFRRAAAAGLPSFMSAHVVYDALDPGRPATLSRRIMFDLLRGEIGFRGVVFSDDLLMKAIALPHGDAAVAALEAGCDTLLVCDEEDLQDAVFATLVREAEARESFRDVLLRAASNTRKLHRSPRPDPSALAAAFTAHREIAASLQELLA
jgi:beta-N-acetylhexosaminidase